MKPILTVLVLGCAIAAWGEPRKSMDDYGKLPMAFEPNQGQADPRVQFLSRGAGYTLFLTSDEAVLILGRQALRMQLAGGNRHAVVAGGRALPGKSNYFIGNDAAKWRTNVPNYGEVRYPGVYSGVDLVYYGKQGQLEYDFVVAPGADPHAIRLDFAGVRRIRIDRDTGDLVLQMDGGDVRFHKPVVYQEAEHRQLIDGRYLVHGHQVSFALGKYDRRRPLVIDPQLAYSTLLGGTVDGFTTAVGIAVDTAGNAYVTGKTPGLAGTSTPFPTTPGAFETQLPGASSVAFVTKLNPTGSALVYSTFLGGTSSTVQDGAAGIAVDASGDAFVTGFAQSSNFPTTSGAFQTQLKGSQNAFVTMLNPTGSALIYSTYLGGSTNDSGAAIAIDSAGDAYVTGAATSTNFPVTPGAFQSSQAGSTNAFITELNPTGSGLIFSTYLGGSTTDNGDAIAVNSSGVYVAGKATSTNFPTTAGAIENPGPGCLGGLGGGFVAELNSTGTALVYSGCLGGQVWGMTLDSAGAAYLVGEVYYHSLNTTNQSFQACNPTGGAGFLLKVNPAGSAMEYGTCLGGGFSDLTSVAVDSSGNVYVAGGTYQSITYYPLYPTTAGAFQPCQVSGGAVFSKLNPAAMPAATQLVYSTCFGSGGADAITLDSAGNVYLAGSGSTGFPVTPGAFQTTLPGVNVSAAYVSKFIPGSQVWPLALNLGNLGFGSTSAPQTTTLTNSESSTLTVNSIQITGPNAADFAQTNTCNSAMTTGGSCTISVTFSPSVTGTETANIVITDSDTNNPMPVVLTGNSQGAASLSPGSLNFGTQVVMQISAPMNVTLTNTGYHPLTVTSLSVTGANAGDFAQTGNCVASSPLAVGSSCSIGVTFTPSLVASESATLVVTSDGYGSPQQVSLQGTGAVPLLMSPTYITYSPQLAGTTATYSPVTLTVTAGGAPVTITGMSATGPFSPQTNCITTISTSCQFGVNFTPPAVGNFSGTLSVAYNGYGSPLTAFLQGSGVAPAVTLRPVSINFGGVPLGSTSSTQTVTLTNTGSYSLTIASLTLTGTNPGDFILNNACPISPNTLGVNQNCTFTVQFTPAAEGARSASVSIADNASGSPQSVALSGTGQAPLVKLSTTSLAFGNQNVGTTATKTVNLTNTGNLALTISSLTLTGDTTDFSQTNNCGSSVASGKSCTITVIFAPHANGADSAAISIADNAAGSPQTVSISGTGTTPGVGLSPTSLTFAVQKIGTTSPSKSVTLTNTGTGTLSIASITVTGINSSEFALTNHCPLAPSTLGAGKTCTFSVTFTPAAAGTRTAAITITDNAGGSPQSVALSGTGTAVTLSPTSLNFGSITVGKTGPPKTVTLSVAGSMAVSISSISFTGADPGDFAQTNTCGSSVAGGASCTISVTFKPTAKGTRTATLAVSDNGGPSPQTVSLTGTGM